MDAPAFYKILMDLPSKLALPRGFTDNYPEIQPCNVKLRIASGATWKVMVERSNRNEGEREEEDCYFFTEGWSKFLQDMGLKRMEVLVFSYAAGNSTFDVTAYDSSATEKASNSLASNNPRFEALMNEQNHYRMNVSEEFYVAAGLIGEKKVAVEYSDGGRVEVGVNIWRSDEGCSVMIFGVGWRKFWEQNGMGVGKAYSFEFLPRKKVIQVTPIIA